MREQTQGHHKCVAENSVIVHLSGMLELGNDENAFHVGQCAVLVNNRICRGALIIF